MQLLHLDLVWGGHLPKKVLGVSKHTPSRYIYLLTREPFLIEDLRYTLLLPSTNAYNKLLAERQQKREEVDDEFYSTSAMIDRSWTEPNQKMRSTVNRLAVHGFHHKVCVKTAYHTVTEECVCKLCSEKCPKYHVLTCKKNNKSITELSSEDWKLEIINSCTLVRAFLLLLCWKTFSEWIVAKGLN